MTKKTLIKYVAIALLIVSSIARAAGPNLDKTRTALGEWVKLRKLISEEKSGWKFDQELMKDTLEILTTEMYLLEDRILYAEENTTVADKRREELTVENEILKEAWDTYHARKVARKRQRDSTVNFINHNDNALQANSTTIQY